MTSRSGRFTPELLLDRLRRLPATSRYWVGFSGGADSTALLEALSEVQHELNAAIHAVHFNHGLQREADGWQTHCANYCKKKAILLKLQPLNFLVGKNNSVELQARQARYQAVSKLLNQGDIYLTAHHADDHAETLFLHLMRGSGLDGLAGIPALRELGSGFVARPMLGFRRQDLEDFLRSREIDWITDPSNLEDTADRNFLRNDIFPRLESRWPGITRRLNQSARHVADASDTLSRLLGQKFGILLADPITLPLKPFLELTQAEQALVLRQWVKNGGAGTPPPRQRLEEFLSQLASSSHASSQPEICWGNWLIKRYDRFLWLQEADFSQPCPSLGWNSSRCLDLGPDFGSILLSGSLPASPPAWEVGPRKEGASMAIRFSGPRKKPKDLLRACGVPTWLRSAVPMLYRDGQLEAIGDWLPGAGFRHWLEENQLSYRWEPTHPLLRKLQSVSVQCLATSEYAHE